MFVDSIHSILSISSQFQAHQTLLEIHFALHSLHTQVYPSSSSPQRLTCTESLPHASQKSSETCCAPGSSCPLYCCCMKSTVSSRRLSSSCISFIVQLFIPFVNSIVSCSQIHLRLKTTLLSHFLAQHATINKVLVQQCIDQTHPKSVVFIVFLDTLHNFMLNFFLVNLWE